MEEEYQWLKEKHMAGVFLDRGGHVRWVCV